MTCKGGVPCSGNHRYQQWQEKEECLKCKHKHKIEAKVIKPLRGYTGEEKWIS